MIKKTLAAVVILFVLFMVVCNIPQGPYKYIVNSKQERMGLLGTLPAEREQWIQVSNPNDPDQLWPKDRLLIVFAIEMYILEHNSVPENMEILYQSKYLDEKSLQYKYTLEKKQESWSLSLSHASGMKLIAYGN